MILLVLKQQIINLLEHRLGRGTTIGEDRRLHVLLVLYLRKVSLPVVLKVFFFMLLLRLFLLL